MNAYEEKARFEVRNRRGREPQNMKTKKGDRPEGKRQRAKEKKKPRLFLAVTVTTETALTK